MSYILDALKKSDQQRQRGVTPTLPVTQAVAAPPRQTTYYGLFAAVLLLAGIIIGWLRPWQTEPPAKELDAAKLAAPLAPLPAPVVQELPNIKAAARLDASKPELPVSNQAPSAAPVAAPVAASGVAAIAMTELPAAIQQELPAMAIQLHAYASNPADRLVSINSHMLGEGGTLAPGLRLEQITPDGMIFSFKGYRFQRGVH